MLGKRWRDKEHWVEIYKAPLLAFETPQLQLKDVMLSKVSQTEKAKYWMMSLLYENK